MPNCTNEPIEMGKVGRRDVEASLDGGDIVRDGGVLLLGQLDQRSGLTGAITRLFDDKQRRASVAHGLHELLAAHLWPARVAGWRRCAITMCCGAIWHCKLITRRLRQAWPRIRLIVRGDSGFCRHRRYEALRSQACNEWRWLNWRWPTCTARLAPSSA